MSGKDSIILTFPGRFITSFLGELLIPFKGNK